MKRKLYFRYTGTDRQTEENTEHAINMNKKIQLKYKIKEYYDKQISNHNTISTNNSNRIATLLIGIINIANCEC